MKKNNICLVSFVYPLIEKYLEDFFLSLKRQNAEKVDYIIVDDKYNKKIKNFSGTILKAPDNLSIVEVRTWIIEKLIKEEYELVIFLDADDIMDSNRINKIIEEYEKTDKKYGFYYNHLFLLKEKKDFYRGQLPNILTDIEQILNGNCLGMSHTAINLKIVKKVLKNFLPPSNIIAYDWLLHSFLLLNGFKGKKVDTITYYRIYENNIAGKIENNEKKILLGLKVKRNHYSELKKYNEMFVKKYLEILQTEEYILKNGIEKYMELLKNGKKEVYWWKNIKTLTEIEGEKMIKIKDREIKNYSKPYIIAEIGANHNGDIELAKKLIAEAKKCGADAVKFQSWTPSSLICKEEYNNNQVYTDSPKKHFGSLKEMVEKYYLREEQHFELKKYCDNLKIDFCSTPFSKEEVDLLMKLDVLFIKVASMDINNLELLKYMAKQQKPIILSTGMSTLSEIEKAIEIIENEGNNQIILLHCISIYPPKYEDINLNNILMLEKTFGYPVGFSDHTIGTSIPLASVALGSYIIEKHFTLDKNMPGWDHEISADPQELEIICKESKNITEALGTYKRIVSKDEQEKLKKFRRSVVLANDLKEGETIKLENLEFKRPGTGIRPDEVKYVIGKKLIRDIEKDEILKWEDLK